MISAEGLQRLLNLSEPPSDELIDVYLQFCMIFPRVEQSFFGGFAKGEDSLNYARTLLDALCVGRERDRRGIVNGLQNDAATDLNTMSTVLKIVIRIRNNLFHGNKDAYLFVDSQEQAQLLRWCVRFLQGLLN